MNRETILKMEGISKVFAGVEALKNVSFSLKKGEIHALIGENGAGKSTLMKILIGIHKPELGTITFRGKKVQFRNTADALNNGISMIHQEISLVQQMDVAENIWLGREKQYLKAGLINLKKRYDDTEKLFRTLDIDIDPHTMVEQLSVAQMQLVELARAVSYHSDIIIMDEPTSALTTKEIEILYRVVRELSSKGVAVIFISHKLEEIFEICTRVTVLRDGCFIDTLSCKDLDKGRLMNMIAGREMAELFQKTPVRRGAVKLEVRDLTSAGIFSHINFKVHAGEILGFYGLMGAGRTEIMRSVFGLDKYSFGEIIINGNAEVIRGPEDAVRHGMGMLTEDRLRLGSIYTMSILGNATIASFKNICNGAGFFSPRYEEEIFRAEAKELSVKFASPHDLIGQLSGGNQQKVLVERWLLTKPDILIVDEPTRGIDVGAKREIYALLDQMAQKGMAIVLISSELPEIISLADRIIVVREGKTVYECSGENADQITLVSHAFGME